MNIILKALWLYLIYLAPSFITCSLIWFLGRKKVQWFKWEYSILIAPWILYIISLGINYSSTQNAVGYFFYPFFFGLATPLGPLIRVLLGQRVNQKTVALVTLSVFCLLIFSIPFIPAFNPGLWRDR